MSTPQLREKSLFPQMILFSDTRSSAFIHKIGPDARKSVRLPQIFARRVDVLDCSRVRIGSLYTRADSLADLSCPTNRADKSVRVN